MHSADTGVQIQLGNKILVYISCCLAGRAYPLGDIQPDRVARVRTNVLHCLTALHTTTAVIGEPAYPRLWTLIQFDTREFFNVLSLAFSDVGLTDAEKQGVVDILMRMMVDNSGFTQSQVMCRIDRLIDNIYCDATVLVEVKQCITNKP